MTLNDSVFALVTSSVSSLAFDRLCSIASFEYSACFVMLSTPEARINYVIPSAPECVAAETGVVVGKPNVPASEIGADLHREMKRILVTHQFDELKLLS